MSNSDNLGAVLDPRILRWFAERELPFAMEVADRTESDKKGGHLARRRGGGLVLRETSQISDDDQAAFEDVTRHRYFNANTLWIDLQTLARTLRERDGVLGLPMIVNRKTVDPTDPSLAGGDPARERDGGGDRRLRGRGRGARPAAALRAGQDDQRPALAALGRVRDLAGRRAGVARARARTISRR